MTHLKQTEWIIAIAIILGAAFLIGSCFRDACAMGTCFQRTCFHYTGCLGEDCVCVVPAGMSQGTCVSIH